MSNDNAITRVFKLWAKISMMVVDGTRDATTVAEALQNILNQPTRHWREEDGVIYFSVTSDNESGEGWIKRLEAKGYRVSDYTKSVLHSPDFKPTNGVTTKIAVLKGSIFEDSDRITQNIRAEADKRGLTKPDAEVACLIRDQFSDEEVEAMGLWWIVAMHEPIKDSDGGPNLLGAGRSDDGRWLDVCCGDPDCRWDREFGFAVAVLQV